MKKYTTVAEYVHDLDGAKRLQVQTLRKIILSVEPKIEEHIKWNAPSYVFNGEDRITFNLQNKDELVKLVLHMGARREEDKNGIPIMEDVFGRVAWSSDIRGLMSFKNIDDIMLNKQAITDTIKNWLRQK